MDIMDDWIDLTITIIFLAALLFINLLIFTQYKQLDGSFFTYEDKGIRMVEYDIDLKKIEDYSMADILAMVYYADRNHSDIINMYSKDIDLHSNNKKARIISVFNFLKEKAKPVKAQDMKYHIRFDYLTKKYVGKEIK